jgi:hypothetical protein
MENSVKSIEELGFEPVGTWGSYDGEKTEPNLSDPQKSDVVYALIVNEKINYVGRTVRELREMMQNIKNPDNTQSTNKRINDNLCKQQGEVSIYALSKDNVKLDGLKGLLIKNLSPEWNIRGK